MNPERDLGLIVILVVLFVFSIFVSAVETAFLRVPPVRVHALAAEGSRSAVRLERLAARTTQVLNAILLAALLAQIGAATVAGILADRWFGPVGVTIASAVLTFLLYVYAEAIPKTYAVRHADRVSLALAFPLSAVEFLLRPLVKILVWLADLQMPGKGVVTSPTITEGELRMLASRAAKEGEITPDDLRLIEKAFRVGDRRVDDIMVPRPEIVAVSDEATAAEALEVALRAGHRRIPVFDQDRENVVGIVRQRDLLLLAETERPGTPVLELAEHPILVPESKRVLDLLADMQRTGTHEAVVVDEYGSTAGLVTVEDIAEELLGSMSATRDEAVVELAPGHWSIDALLPVEDLAELLDVDLGDADWNTAAGLVLTLLGRLPKVGDEVSRPPHVFRVVGMSGRRISRLEVRRV